MDLVQKLREKIENDIIMHQYPSGKKLDETQLAQHFGVSRTPVREALMQLSAIGLVELRPNRGAVLIDPGPHRLFEMFEVMGELEAMAGELAARRHTDQDIENIKTAHQRCIVSAENNDADAYYYDNEVFHHAIYNASHNSFLIEQCMALHQRLQPYRRLQLRFRNRIHSSLKEHAEIVEAIISGDGEAARQYLRMHISVQGERFGDLMASLATRPTVES